MARPYWSGHIQISLVSFGVKLFTATEAASQITFHEIDRRTGERVRRRSVSDGEGSSTDTVDRSNIVKGFEYTKGEYVTIEPDEIAHLRIPSKKTLQIVQFVDAKEIDPQYFEKPYFVVPENEIQAQAFAVIRKALEETGKVGLGEVSFTGREHLIAIAVPADKKSRGLMAYTMRYGAELRPSSEYFGEIKETNVDADQLSLAKELMSRQTAKFDPSKFKDDYEIALRELIDAKMNHLPIPKEEEAPQRGKVISLMDALRQSLGEDKAAAASSSDQEAPTRKSPKPAAATAKTKSAKTGPTLVKAAGNRRKSA